MFPIAQRADEPELLDRGDYRHDELRGNLADLRAYNRWLGGVRILERSLARLFAAAPGDRAITLLDVATGSADIPHELARRARRRGVILRPLGLDRNPDVLGEARRGLIPLIRADALSLPCADRSIDIVICSNFLHHLDRDGAVAVMREMKRVARLGIVAVDLTRTRMAWGLVWLATRLTTRNRLTRHDSTLSVERAFTKEELGQAAREAGLTGAVVSRLGPVRIRLRWLVEASP